MRLVRKEIPFGLELLPFSADVSGVVCRMPVCVVKRVISLFIL